MFFILYLSTCLALYFHSSYYWLFVKLSDVCSAKCCQGTVALAEFLFFQHRLLWFSAHHYYKALGIGFHCFQETLGAAGVIGTLECGMNEQLLGSVTTCLMKCDGHQFLSVELTHVRNLCAPILLDQHSTLSQHAGKWHWRINHEKTHSTHSIAKFKWQKYHTWNNPIS